jgi:AcrR family transcriptional regulator
MLTARAQQAERTRQAVLTVARRLFAEHGFDGTSLRLIADTAGVSKANVYYYFRTKNAILAALLDDSVTRLGALLDAAGRIAGDVARVEYIVDGFVDQVVVHRAIPMLSQADPGVRRDQRTLRKADDHATRGLRMLFGAEPTVAERAAYFLVLDLGSMVRRLADLSDGELRDTLKQLCLRLLFVRD